jgi:hypothetical protein
MKSYDIPPSTEYLTAAEAQQALNRLRADALSDSEHPAFNGNHPQSGDFAEFTRRLYAVLAQAEAEAKDAAAAQALEDARDETGDLTPEQCLARAKVLMKTKGYIVDDGTLSPEERAALSKEISTLYRVGCQQEPETSTPEEEEVDDDL